jgi:hypothetical protein
VKLPLCFEIVKRENVRSLAFFTLQIITGIKQMLKCNTCYGIEEIVFGKATRALPATSRPSWNWS